MEIKKKIKIENDSVSGTNDLVVVLNAAADGFPGKFERLMNRINATRRSPVFAVSHENGSYTAWYKEGKARAAINLWNNIRLQERNVSIITGYRFIKFYDISATEVDIFEIMGSSVFMIYPFAYIYIVIGRHVSADCTRADGSKKYLQRLYGCISWIYWLSHFLVDILFVISVGSVAMLLLYHIENPLKSIATEMCSLMMLQCLQYIPFIYLLTFFFTGRSAVREIVLVSTMVILLSQVPTIISAYGNVYERCYVTTKNETRCSKKMVGLMHVLNNVFSFYPLWLVADIPTSATIFANLKETEMEKILDKLYLGIWNFDLLGYKLVVIMICAAVFIPIILLFEHYNVMIALSRMSKKRLPSKLIVTDEDVLEEKNKITTASGSDVSKYRSKPRRLGVVNFVGWPGWRLWVVWMVGVTWWSVKRMTKRSRLVSRFGSFVGVSDLVMPAQNFCVNDLKQTMEKRSKQDTYNVYVNDICKWYGGNEVPAVYGLTFGVPRSQCFGLLGVNGAGKSSTFKMLTGFEKASSGEAYLDKVAVAGPAAQRTLSKFEGISYCPQEDILFMNSTVDENIYLFGTFRGLTSSDIQSQRDILLEELDLEKYRKRNVGSLSGGNKRKVQLAIALLDTKPVIFLDEPSSGMDPSARRRSWNSIRRAVDRGASVILTSHSMEECEVLCDRLAIMIAGTIQCIGSCQYLKDKLGNRYTIKIRVLTGHPIKEVKDFMAAQLPKAYLTQEPMSALEYQILSKDMMIYEILEVMEDARLSLPIRDYALSQITLEEVFLEMVGRYDTMKDMTTAAPKSAFVPRQEIQLFPYNPLEPPTENTARYGSLSNQDSPVDKKVLKLTSQSPRLSKDNNKDDTAVGGTKDDRTPEGNRTPTANTDIVQKRTSKQETKIIGNNIPNLSGMVVKDLKVTPDKLPSETSTFSEVVIKKRNGKKQTLKTADKEKSISEKEKSITTGGKKSVATHPSFSDSSQELSN